MRIVFRVDSSIYMGTGHVMRCLALANRLRDKGAIIEFICREHPGQMVGLIQGNGYTVSLLPAPKTEQVVSLLSNNLEWIGVSWKQDAEETINCIESNKPDFLIVDHYGIDHNWHGLLRPFTKKIMVIDDLANRKLDCDLLLDQTYSRKECAYKLLTPKDCQLLIGTSYALLRPEFERLRQKAIEKRQRTESIFNILIFMGGLDKSGSTNFALDGILKLFKKRKFEIDVVIGESSPYYHIINKRVLELNLPINVLSNITNMADLILNADIAIGAGGTSSWERCSLALPTLVKVLSVNQRENANNLQKAGAIKIWSDSDDLANTLEELVVSINQWKNMSDNSSVICDASGAPRVAESMYAQC
jgi:UDP-2,4-diacetamido-2,4,6-trideoxy-beta-L-altropyranose hydrolase